MEEHLRNIKEEANYQGVSRIRVNVINRRSTYQDKAHGAKASIRTWGEL